MRPLLGLSLLILVAGCAAPPPGSTTSSGGSTLGTSPSQDGCATIASTLWTEPGIHPRAANSTGGAGLTFHNTTPSPGATLQDAAIRNRWGDGNVTSFQRSFPGETGRLVYLGLGFYAPAAEGAGPGGSRIGGDFRLNATIQDIRAEYLGFARRILAADDATLERQADDFAATSSQAHYSDGEYLHAALDVPGPYRVDALLGELQGSATITYDGGPHAPTVESGAWQLAISLRTRRGEAEPTFLETNRLDYVKFYTWLPWGAGHAQLWERANATFEQLGWPRPSMAGSPFTGDGWCPAVTPTPPTGATP